MIFNYVASNNFLKYSKVVIIIAHDKATLVTRGTTPKWKNNNNYNWMNEISNWSNRIKRKLTGK